MTPCPACQPLNQDDAPAMPGELVAAWECPECGFHLSNAGEVTAPRTSTPVLFPVCHQFDCLFDRFPHAL